MSSLHAEQCPGVYAPRRIGERNRSQMPANELGALPPADAAPRRLLSAVAPVASACDGACQLGSTPSRLPMPIKMSAVPSPAPSSPKLRIPAQKPCDSGGSASKGSGACADKPCTCAAALCGKGATGAARRSRMSSCSASLSSPRYRSGSSEHAPSETGGGAAAAADGAAALAGAGKDGAVHAWTTASKAERVGAAAMLAGAADGGAVQAAGERTNRQNCL